jgi:hypothetical protein
MCIEYVLTACSLLHPAREFEGNSLRVGVINF